MIYLFVYHDCDRISVKNEMNFLTKLKANNIHQQSFYNLGAQNNRIFFSSIQPLNPPKNRIIKMQSGQSSMNSADVSVSQQRMATGSEDSPSHLLEKQQRNFCIVSDSQTFPISSIMETEFHRYSKPHEERLSSTIDQNKQPRTNESSINRVLSKSASTNDCYIDWKVYKNKPDINMLPFPYCIEQSLQYKKSPFSPLSLLNPFRPKSKQPTQETKKQTLPKIYKLKIQNKVKLYTGQNKQNKTSKPYFNFQKTPINEYLNYELAEQINTGLREVQIMAQEIKRIKKAKKIASEDDSALKQKYSKGLRIRRSYVKNFKGIYKTNTNI